MEIVPFSKELMDHCKILIDKIHETGSNGPFYFVKDSMGRTCCVTKDEMRLKGLRFS